jgi:hypothetical protein
MMVRISVLALISVSIAACGGSADVAEQASENVDALGEALAEAVILSYESSRGGAEPDAGTRAVNEARTLTLKLSETSGSLNGEAQALSLGLVELANQAIVWVGQSEYELAEKLRLEEFAPTAEQFNAALTAPIAEPVVAAAAASWSTGGAIAVLSTIAGIGLLLFVRYRRGDIPDPVVEARRRKAERSGQTFETRERKWSEITPLLTDPTTDEPLRDDPNANRSTRARTMDVDLRGLLMTALHQVKDYGWDMSVVCPEVQITADPVKLRNAVVAALGTAFLGGAQRVGVVVEDLEGDVLLTIGRDAPPNRSDAEEFVERFTTQVSLALGVDELEASLIDDEDVSLMSVSLGRKVGADQVSEPVV